MMMMVLMVMMMMVVVMVMTVMTRNICLDLVDLPPRSCFVSQHSNINTFTAAHNSEKIPLRRDLDFMLFSLTDSNDTPALFFRYVNKNTRNTGRLKILSKNGETGWKVIFEMLTIV